MLFFFKVFTRIKWKSRITLRDLAEVVWHFMLNTSTFDASTNTFITGYTSISHTKRFRLGPWIWNKSARVLWKLSMVRGSKPLTSRLRGKWVRAIFASLNAAPTTFVRTSSSSSPNSSSVIDDTTTSMFSSISALKVHVHTLYHWWVLMAGLKKREQNDLLATRTHQHGHKIACSYSCTE